LSARPISDPLAFPLPGFSPPTPGFDPNWYDPNFNPYGEPTPPVVPDTSSPPPISPGIVIPVTPPPTAPPIIEPTPVSPPTMSSSSSSSSGGPSTRPTRAVLEAGAAERDAIIRAAIESARRDTAIRSGEAIVIDAAAQASATARLMSRFGAAILGPLGVIVGEALTPHALGTGTVSDAEQIDRARDYALERRDELTQQVDAMLERLERMSSGRPSIGQDIARGGGVIAGGIVLGGEVLRDVLERAPVVPIGGDRDELVTELELPELVIPEPTITQPVVPFPEAPIPEIPPPTIAQATRSAPTPATGTPQKQPSRPSPTMPSPVMTTPNWGRLARQWTDVLSRARARARAPSSQRFIDPLTQPFADTPMPSPATTPSAAIDVGTSSVPSSSSSPLTSPQASPLSSRPPPRSPTRTRTKEDRCHCKTKPRKKARECGARGQLMWVSGPKKGKPAGSRCVSFKDKP